MDESNSPNNEINKSDKWKPSTPREMISTFLHETRTPINMIKGYVEILSNEDAKDHHPEALKNISLAVGRLEDLWLDMSNHLGELMRKSDT